MKKIALLILILAGLVFSQGAPQAMTYGAPDVVSALIIGGLRFDTLAGATDSATIISSMNVPKHAELILGRAAITGSTDSIRVRLRLDCYDQDGVFLQSMNIDSFTTSAGEQIVLPIGKTVLCQKMTLKAMAYADNGAAVIFNYFRLYSRVPWVEYKPVQY